MSKAEVITIMVLFHLSGYRIFKHFYLDRVKLHMKGDFPGTVSYNRFMKLMGSCLMPMTMFLKTCHTTMWKTYRTIWTSSVIDSTVAL